MAQNRTLAFLFTLFRVYKTRSLCISQ
jgi:hypothetical protein